MPNPLFSTYRQGETRVTSTIIGVLEHVNNQLVENILQALTDDSDLLLVPLGNQVTGIDSVPDAAIKNSTAVWFETKTSRDAVDRDSSKPSPYICEAELQCLIVLTPDARLSGEVAVVDNERIV
jgi:hypothetical protein